MFRLITAEFNRMLGNDFVLYFSENETSPFRREIVNNGKIGGIVRVEGGSVKPIEGFSGLEAEGVIEFLVETSIPNLEDKVTALIETSNGVIKSDGTAFQYLINYGVLAPTGDMQRMSGERATKDFLIWRLPFSIVLTEELEFGNRMALYFSLTPISIPTDAMKVKGVMNISFDATSVVTEDPRTSRAMSSLLHEHTYRKLSVDMLVLPNDNIQRIIRETQSDRAGNVFYIGFRNNPEFIIMPVIVERITSLAPVGGFQSMSVLFAETKTLSQLGGV